MTDTGADGDHDLREEDRLPWLESVAEERDEGPSALRVAALVALGLVVIAALVFGYLMYQRSRGGHGSGQLIQAQEGSYKVRPEESGGMKVAGEGDTRFVTSEGGAARGALDVDALPEQPVDGRRVAEPQAPAGKGEKTVVAAVPGDSKNLERAPKAPSRSSTAGTAPGGGGSVIQLGSFPSEARANRAWKQFSERFKYLADLGSSVQKAEVDGNTVYRLRVNAGSAGQAKQLCGKLKVAGEACYIPAQ
ncbi:SPOR domain-containing protein [Stakelama saccharophila]|uniref:SPOR domain-containing protein n=1 Tax=Stakelama saccharophila TaxID=3075605 RepID=A0ABZ0BCI2_9SPHN|nr:SPOR domain-containing protein [Stakelama sp. W311]WNO54902.1 SPOR domain-containing protein [Stakelama sp. W311]